MFAAVQPEVTAVADIGSDQHCPALLACGHAGPAGPAVPDAEPAVHSAWPAVLPAGLLSQQCVF